MITSPDDLRRVRKGILRTVFKVGYPTITKWMPEIDAIGANNDDGTFDLIKMVQWKLEKNDHRKPEEKLKLELEKMQKDIELKDAQISKTLQRYIERSVADQEKIALLKIISSFLEKVPHYVKQQFHMIHADIAEKRLRDIFKEAMERIASAPEAIEEDDGL